MADSDQKSINQLVKSIYVYTHILLQVDTIHSMKHQNIEINPFFHLLSDS